ncbi:MAG: hypothetical protein JSV86_05250 [Gemmatimonadota bacterium]|jgi:hypothetical protein|nr:MAG: hypothetical protein JSV86_05250 [Gemmatimonadota bacterium]
MANLLTDNRFPYFSHAFNCEVRDRAHLKALEKRYGVHHSTKADVERGIAAVEREQQEVEQRLAEGDDRYRNAWHYADFRRSIETGAAVKHLPPEKRAAARKQLLAKYCK